MKLVVVRVARQRLESWQSEADRSLFSSGRKQISSLELKNFIWIEDRIEITIEKVDASRWWFLSRRPRAWASSTFFHLPITRKKIELTRAIFETTSSLGTRQSRSLNWNQPRNQRHVNLVKEGPPPWTSFIHTRSHLTLEPISTVSIMSCIGIMRVTRAATRKCASKLVSNFTAISRNTWSGE